MEHNVAARHAVPAMMAIGALAAGAASMMTTVHAQPRAVATVSAEATGTAGAARAAASAASAASATSVTPAAAETPVASVTPAASSTSAAGQRAPTAAARRMLQLDDYYRFETASAPAISPDGRWVAFVRGTIVESANRSRHEVWLAAVDGATPPRRLAETTGAAAALVWSPDSRVLALPSPSATLENGRPVRGTVFYDITRPEDAPAPLPGVGGTPRFSPDNQWIAFTKAVPPTAAAHASPAAAAAPESSSASASDALIASRFKGHVIDWMNYRFDGRGYLPDPRDPKATPPEELFVVPRSGGTPRQLTKLGVDVRDLAWRPDSGALAFVANLSQRDEYIYEHADLFTVTLADAAVTRLTDDGYHHSAPAWSPDGATLAVVRRLGLSAVIASKQSRGAPTDVVTLPAAAGSPQKPAIRNLTDTWDLLPAEPRWSRDGSAVFFTCEVKGNNHLCRVAASGSGSVTQVTSGDRDLNDIALADAADRIAYAAATPDRPAEIFTAALDGTGERQISHVNDALLAQLRLGRTERVTFASRDGTPIEGGVVLPPHYDRARRWPLILAIHGGPHGAYADAFSFQFQWYAANGHIVVYTNPRGSTGYGESFLWATWGGGWGGLDYDDVMAGVDHVVGKYPIDPARLGVTGYSYGGFLTNWIITKTPRFAAAIAGAGITNWISDYGTADIPRTKESEFFGTPWEPKGRALLERQSPIYYAGAVKTPTLFIHGEADLRVPIEQAEQMYVALKKRRVPAQFVRYPGMYHGGWSPWDTVHRYQQEQRWWATYLGGTAAAGNTTSGVNGSR